MGLLAPARAAAVGLALIAILPAKEVVQLNMLHSRPSTRLVAREWIASRVPRGSIVVKEQKTAPLQGIEVRAVYSRALAESGRTVDQYRAHGVRYLVTNAAVSGAYRVQPSRYPTQAASTVSCSESRASCRNSVPMPAATARSSGSTS